MAQSIVLIRVTLDWEDAGVVGGYVRDMVTTLDGVEGFLGGAAWKGLHNPFDRLVVFSYDSPEASQRGYVASSEMPTLIERMREGTMPAEVKVLTVHHADGRFHGGVPANSLVSLSLRTADPGYSTELIQEYEDIFSGLGMTSGFAGSLIGVNSQMMDEVAGLAAWKTVEDYAESMLEQTFPEIQLYEPLEDV